MYTDFLCGTIVLVCQDLRATPKWNVLAREGSLIPAWARSHVEAVLYQPVTIPELVALVEQLDDFVDDLESVQEIVSLYRSFLTVRDDAVYFRALIQPCYTIPFTAPIAYASHSPLSSYPAPVYYQS